MTGLNEIKAKILPILKRYGIEKAGIFGSFARQESRNNDIDILVQIKQDISLIDFVGIRLELEDVLNMKVDLVEYDALKPTIKDEVLRDEVPIL